jgi:zinc/manganese transport system ATP-binding protein
VTTRDQHPDAQLPLLEVQDLDVDIEGRTIIRGATFSVEHGEFTGLIGSNGTGKTTLIRVILGLMEPSGGRVLLHGRPLGRSSSVGYVPQKVALDPEMPIRARDLVALGLDGHRLGIARRSRETLAAVDEMLHAVEADEFADRRVGSLSGGEQQRVLIAHALVSRPELILLDEPLANLDPGSAQEIVQLLHRIVSRDGVAVLLSSHEMNPLLPVMDRIVYVANAHVASGTTDEVIRPEVLSALYGRHVEVLRVHGRVLVVAEPTEDSTPVPDHAPIVVE